MALIPRGRMNRSARSFGLTLSACLPLACYITSAAAHSHWYDAGEFVATGLNLGISHPPGHPLYSVVAAAFSLLPVGPLAFRIALGSAVMAAVACAALYLAIETTIRAQGLQRAWVITPIAVGATWLCAGTQGFWLQAIRPEVYALQAALCFIVIERVVALEAAWPTRDVRPLLTAGFALGLGLANHHFLAVLMIPALSPTAARVLRGRGAGALWLAAAFVAAGLSVYLLLPVRASAAPTPNLGVPTTLARFFWVVSAQVFQKNTGSGVPEPTGDRVADVLIALVTNLHFAWLLAIGGAYALVRTSGVRRIGLIWILAGVVPMFGRAWLGFTRDNPDAEGYLLTSLGAGAALSAAFIAQLVTPLGGMDTRSPSRSAVILALAAGALGLAQLQHGSAQTSFAQLTAPDELDEFQRRRLPPRAIVLAHQPETIFAFWGAQAQDHARPDVTLVPMPFLDHPGMVQSLLDRDPELIELLRGYMLLGQLQQPDLQSLALVRPLLIELDPRVPPTLYETLVPMGLYYQVVAAGTTDADERIGHSAQIAMYETLYRRLGAQVHESGTRKQLLWHHYMDALYYMAYGDLPGAYRAIAQGRAIEPLDGHLRAMEQALRESAKPGPMDITRFLPGAR